MTTEPKPEKQNPPAAPDEETRNDAADENASSPERDGFFKRVRGVLRQPIHPSEAEEIVIMEGDSSQL